MIWVAAFLIIYLVAMYIWPRYLWPIFCGLFANRHLVFSVAFFALIVPLSGQLFGPYQQRMIAKKSVVPGISVNAPECGPDFPLRIRFSNYTPSRIRQIEFSVILRRTGSATQVGRISKAYSKLIGPGGAYGSCHQLPQLSLPAQADELTFEFDYDRFRVTFESS